jgi:hypothetical protein
MNQYIHIGAEVATITALTITFNKKLKQLENRIEALEKNQTSRQPSVQIFEARPQTVDPGEFIMSFFPMFSNVSNEQEMSSATIEEIEDVELDEQKLKTVFIKHLAFLADQDAEIPT